MMGEDLQVMKEMWLGAAVFGRRGRMRGREREKLGECINLGYLSVFRTGDMIVTVCGLVARGVKRDLGDLGPWAWANEERLDRCVANQFL